MPRKMVPPGMVRCRQQGCAAVFAAPAGPKVSWCPACRELRRRLTAVHRKARRTEADEIAEREARMTYRVSHA